MAAEALLSLRFPRRSPESTHPPRGARWPVGTHAIPANLSSSFRSCLAFAEGAACPCLCRLTTTPTPPPKKLPALVAFLHLFPKS